MKAVTGAVAIQAGTLSAREQQQLTAAESDVERGGQLIFSAMQLIRDNRLYRATHETFEEYCRERWNRTARSVNNAIQMEAVVQRIAEQLPDGNGKNFSHGAASEVADLPAEQAAEIVIKAAETNGKPTAKAVREAREDVAPKKSTAVSEFFDGKPNGKPEKPDLGQCPACAGNRWIATPDGTVCRKCNHPHGEPAGEVEADRISIQRSKTVKTVEALMRAFDDLHLMSPRPKEHAHAIAQCKLLLTEARGWK